MNPEDDPMNATEAEPEVDESDVPESKYYDPWKQQQREADEKMEFDKFKILEVVCNNSTYRERLLHVQDIYVSEEVRVALTKYKEDPENLNLFDFRFMLADHAEDLYLAFCHRQSLQLYLRKTMPFRDQYFAAIKESIELDDLQKAVLSDEAYINKLCRECLLHREYGPQLAEFWYQMTNDGVDYIRRCNKLVKKFKELEGYECPREDDVLAPEWSGKRIP